MLAQSSTIIFILLFAYSLGSYEFIKYNHQLEKSVYPEKITETKTLKKFIELVEKHNLNVSLIISSGKNYEDDNLKTAKSLTLTLPVNGAAISEATLDKQAFEDLADVANKEKITVAGTVSTNNKLKVATNHRKGLPMTRAYKIFTGIKNGRTGFVMDEENYVAQYTFQTFGDDGKNQTTRVFYGDIDVDVIGKSDGIKDNQLNIIKKAVVNGVFTSDDTHAPRAITAILSKELPDESWDAAGPVGENNQVHSDNWVLLKLGWGDKYLVYSV